MQSRKYNSSFQVIPFGAKQIEGDFMATFRVQGQVYRLIESLLYASQESNKFLHIYFVGDENKEADMKCAHFSGVRSAFIILAITI